MNMFGKVRRFETWYEDEQDIEHPISVEVEADGRSDIWLCTELPDCIDKKQEQRIRERLHELYWAAEREAYIRSGQCERDGD